MIVSLNLNKTIFHSHYQKSLPQLAVYLKKSIYLIIFLPFLMSMRMRAVYKGIVKLSRPN